MSKYTHLLGAEEVYRGGRAIQDAAQDMQRAANQFSEALDMHRGFMNEWLNRLEDILNESKSI